MKPGQGFADLRCDRAFFELLTGSHARLLGTPRVPAEADADWLYSRAAFVVLAHQPRRRSAVHLRQPSGAGVLRIWWEEMVGLPSRLSAEAPNQIERAAI